MKHYIMRRSLEYKDMDGGKVMRRFHSLLKVTDFIALLALVCLASSAACTHETAKTTDKGLFHIRLSSSEEILKNGRNEVSVHITDSKGRAVEQAQVDIVPWMPEHHHGAMWTPATIEEGNGLYRSVIALPMPGRWELKVTISKENLLDSTTFYFPDVKN
jgi:hypothetical protein